MTEKYEDIINLPHHVSKTRPQMSMLERAAQFSPFAALNGYDDAVKETGRLTDERIELGDEERDLLDRKYVVKTAFGLNLPDYAAPAVLACLVSNLNERTHWFDVHPAVLDQLQNFTLGVFLSLAMISLKLWELIELAVPMLVILFAGLIVTLLYLYFLVFPVCGKDYDAAIMCAGMAGHGLGASPTGFANMDSVTKKFGKSAIAYLCVTVVGGILMDWVLLVVNTTMVNLFG